jgi:DNA polymerase-3 subunit gamma/tau
VVESFKDRYVAAGKNTDTLYLISALNVLNEAEINYRSARNKRLHVELALIKLCYLAQALQVTNGDTGKKRADQLRPVSFRNIPAMEPVKREAVSAGADAAAKTGGAKLLVETGAAGSPVSEGYPQSANPVVEKAERGEERKDSPAGRGEQGAEKGPAIGEGVTMREAGAEKGAGPAAGGTDRTGNPAGGQGKIPAAGGASLGSLSRIRQQFTDRQASNEANQSKPLEVEALHKAWQQYADYLRENRNPAVQSLELATLRIVNASTFEVVTSNNLEQKFIEQEKRDLSDHLQKAFANKAVSFAVIVEEKAHVEEEPTERPLNKREQFIQIAEQYPLVKELKDRLRLELDY